MDITLCLIVKNEMAKLPACLSSFEGLYQKLVIVDTGSTDATKKIAQTFGAEVFDFVWQKDFAKARNFALSKVNTTWVMMVDADDRIESGTVQGLKKELQNIHENINGICLPYLYSAVRQNRGMMAYLPRIWKNTKHYVYSLPIHEYLDIPRADLKTFLRLPFPITHAKDAKDIPKSYSRNLEILHNAYQQNPNHQRILFYLGHDNQYAGNYAEAIHWYKKYALLKNSHPDELHKIYLGQGLCYLHLNRIRDAKEAFQKAIKTNSAFIEPYLHLGGIAMKEHRYIKAAQIYFRALACVPPHTHVFVNTHLYNGFAQKSLTQALQAIEKN